MYVLRSRLCRKVEVEIRNGAKEAITQERRVVALLISLPSPGGHLVCLCCYSWYILTTAITMSLNMYLVIQCQSLNTLDWFKKLDFQNDLSLDVLDVWLHPRPTTSAQTNESSELTDKLLDVMFRMLKNQLP